VNTSNVQVTSVNSQGNLNGGSIIGNLNTQNGSQGTVILNPNGQIGQNGKIIQNGQNVSSSQIVRNVQNNQIISNSQNQGFNQNIQNPSNINIIGTPVSSSVSTTRNVQTINAQNIRSPSTSNITVIPSASNSDLRSRVSRSEAIQSVGLQRGNGRGRFGLETSRKSGSIGF
jgi:hypothetical protein